MRYLPFLALLLLMPYLGTAYAQIPILVNQTNVCFLNYTAGADMWRNCGIETDWLQFSVLGWEWITGGYFSMFLVAIIIMFSYIKYQKAVYPLIIGTIFLPIAFALFPESFLTWSIIMAGVYIAILIWYIYVRQTKEYAG